MKPNNLIDGIETDIKIEKGLKILQFATQFYLQRAYLRNCPLTYPQGNLVIQSAKQHEQDAIVLAQLNELLINPASNNKGKKGPQEKQVVGQSNVKSRMSKHQEKVTNKRPSIQTPPQANITQATMDISEHGNEKKIAKKSIKISPEAVQQQQSSKITRSKLSQKIAKIASPAVQKARKSIQEQQSSVSAYSISSSSQGMSLDDFSNEYKSKSSDRSHKSLKEDDFYSYYSECKPMSIIKQAEQSDQSLSMYIPKDLKPAKSHKTGKMHKPGFSISDFTSIQDNISIGHSTFIQKTNVKERNFAKIKNVGSQTSNSHSFLNKSISQIKQSDEKSYVLDKKINETEMHILREISDSFADEQNLKNLLRLQNFELEQKFLLHRMQKRFKNCAKDIDAVRRVSWQSLNMPKIDLTFKRPDYAHCIQALK